MLRRLNAVIYKYRYVSFAFVALIGVTVGTFASTKLTDLIIQNSVWNSGTINNATIATPAISNGTQTGTSLSGVTVASSTLSSDTISGASIGTSSWSGGTITSAAISSGTISGASIQASSTINASNIGLSSPAQGHFTTLLDTALAGGGTICPTVDNTGLFGTGTCYTPPANTIASGYQVVFVGGLTIEIGTGTPGDLSGGGSCNTITFPLAFTAAPIVSGIMNNNIGTNIRTLSATSTTSTDFCFGSNGSSATGNWIAIGH